MYSVVFCLNIIKPIQQQQESLVTMKIQKNIHVLHIVCYKQNQQYRYTPLNISHCPITSKETALKCVETSQTHFEF